jgi:carbamoyl-phosphate synthase large subunit
MNILISSAGRRVSLVRAFQKELKKYNPKAKVFA